MLLIPVIDIKNGKLLRTIEGLDDKTSYYCDNPLTTARLFRRENAKVIHITDLDGALTGKTANYPLIKQITSSVSIPVQFGGGIRNLDIAKKLIEELGIYRLVVATAVVEKPNLVEQFIKLFSPSKVIVSIDVKNGYFIKTAWSVQTNIKGIDLALRVKSMGVERIIYQDVSRIGTLRGLDIKEIKEVAVKTGLKVTAAGGIGGYDDLKKIQELERYGVDSIMISRALYENKFPCQEIWRKIEMIDTSLELPKIK